MNKLAKELEDIKQDMKDWQDRNGPELEEENLRRAFAKLSADLEDFKKEAKADIERRRAAREENKGKKTK